MIRMDNITVECTLRVRHTDPNTGDELWDKIIELTVPNNSKLLKGFIDTFFFELPNGSVVAKDLNNTDISVTDVLLGIGDGSATDFSKTLPLTPVKPGSVQVSYTVAGNNYTATDDSSGNIAGDEITAGTIDYTTGDISITFGTAPDSCTPIVVTYTKAATAEAQTGFKVVVATDDNPTLTETGFANVVDINSNVEKVDWYQTETEDIYEVRLTGNYTESSPTSKITGVGIVYIGLKEEGGAVLPYTRTIFKSIVPNTNAEFFGPNGLVLENTTDIFVVFRIRASK